MEDYKVAAVVVTYNRCDLLNNTLKTLLKQDVCAIYVIDNNSKDKTSNIVNNWVAKSKGRVRYHNTMSNLGGAGGFAIGCQLAMASTEKFTHIWLSDDDVTFHHDCLQQLVPYLNKHTILQPMRYDLQGCNAEQSSTHIDLSSIFLLNHKRNSVKDTPLALEKEPFSIDFVPFEGPVIPVQILKFTGLPDKSYFIFSDDLDFSIRARKLGFKILCIPKARLTRWIHSTKSHEVGTWKTYFNYRNFFRIQRLYGENAFVRNRPFFIAALVVGYCWAKLDFQRSKVIINALEDAMSCRFKYESKYKPNE